MSAGLGCPSGIPGSCISVQIYLCDTEWIACLWLMLGSGKRLLLCNCLPVCLSQVLASILQSAQEKDCYTLCNIWAHQVSQEKESQKKGEWTSSFQAPRYDTKLMTCSCQEIHWTLSREQTNAHCCTYTEGVGYCPTHGSGTCHLGKILRHHVIHWRLLPS